MRLSLCIATHNEASNLHYVLDSTIDWVDEVVIVDGESTDDTVQVARSYGSKVKIIETSNPPIFHINKQKAIEAASGEWILQLDADEEITDNLREEIERIANSEWRIADAIAYRIPRKNYFLGRFLMKGGVYPDYTIRLYRRGTMYFPCKDVHENVVPSPESQVPSRVWLGTVEYPMNHYSDPTFGRYWHRWKRYCAIEASRVEENALRLYKNPNRLLVWKIVFIIQCFTILPLYWFLLSYIRHKGFMDGWQGLVFHFMSAMRWWGIGLTLMQSAKSKVKSDSG